MASVTTMIVHSVRPQSNGSLYVRYKFDLLDNLNGNHIVITNSKNVTVPGGMTQEEFLNADMIATAPTILQNKAEQEQLDYQEGSREGLPVLFTDFIKVTPLWDTWDNHTTEWLTYWLSLEDQLELINMQWDLTKISNTDIKNLLGVAQADTSDIRGKVQIAIDMKVELDAYSPFIVNGVWVGQA